MQAPSSGGPFPFDWERSVLFWVEVVLAAGLWSPAAPQSPSQARERWTLQKYLLIAFGGALGSIARYWVGTAVANRLGTKFQYGTFVVNLTACLVIGFSLTYLNRRTGLNPAWRFLIPVGFIGAYSTFSTYEWETLSTLRTGAFFMAALYAFGSLFVGLAAVWCGARIAEFVS